MSVVEYARAILRSWLVIVILAVLGAGGGYALAAATPDSYRSTGAVLVTSDRGDSTSELVQGSTYVQNLVATYVLLAQSELVLQPVIDDLGLETTPRSLAGTISASSPLNSVIIEISATSRSPRLAQEIAENVMSSLSEVVTSTVAPTNAAGEPTVRLTVIESANEPRYAYAPSARTYTAIGGLLGVVLGVVFALTRALVWQTLRTKADLDKITSVPVLGEVVEARRGTELASALLTDPLGIEAESVRGVAANLSFLKLDGGLRSLVITSASPAEAKSSLATALALMLAESGKRTLLVDADLRSPSIATYTQLDGGLGLTDVLIGSTPLEDAVQHWGVDGLDVLSAGSPAPNPGQLLASSTMEALLERARGTYDVVIVDSAPLLAVADAKWLASMTDGAILAVRHDKTTTRAFTRVVETAEAGGMALLGIVLARVPRRGIGRYGTGAYGEKNRRSARLAAQRDSRTA